MANPNTSNNYITKDDSGSSSSSVTIDVIASWTGSLSKTSYDVKQTGQNYDSTNMLFTSNGLSYQKVVNNSSVAVRIQRVTMYVGGSTKQIITFDTPLILAINGGYCFFYDGLSSTASYSANGSAILASTTLTRQNYNVNFSSSGGKTIVYKIEFSYVSNSVTYNTYRETNGGTIIVYDKVVNSIYFTNENQIVRSYYKNATFNETAIVYANYKTYIGGNVLSGVSNDVTSVCSRTKANGSTVTSSFQQMLTYSGKTINYTATCVIASSHSDTLVSKYKLGTTISGITATVTYSNSETDTNLPVTITNYNPNVSGSQTITLTVHTVKTNEDISWTKTITVVAPTLSITTPATKTHYDYDDTTIDLTGLVAVLDYGSLGTESATGLTSVWQGTRTESSDSQTIYLTYNGICSTTYSVYIDRIISISANKNGLARRYIIGSTPVSVSASVTLTKKVNNVTSTETVTATVNNPSRTTTGDKTITWSYTSHGLTKTDSHDYTAYDYKSLTVENATTSIYSSSPTINLRGDFTVWGNPTDENGAERLTSEQYSVNPAEGTTVSASGSYTITNTIGTARPVTINYTFIQLAPAQGATYTLTGIIDGTFYNSGDEIPVGTLTISEMNDGTPNYTLYPYQIDLVKGGTTITNRRPTEQGTYTVKVKVDGSYVSYNNGNDITIKVDGVHHVEFDIQRGTHTKNKMLAGWQLQASDFIANKYMDSDTTTAIPVSENEISFSPTTFSYNNPSVSLQVTIAGISATQTITVVSISSITATAKTTKTYYNGQTLDKSNYNYSIVCSDTTFNGEYSDVSVDNITCSKSTLTPDNAMLSAACSFTLSFTDPLSGKTITTSSLSVDVIAIKELVIKNGTTEVSKNKHSSASYTELIGKEYFNKNSEMAFSGYTLEIYYTNSTYVAYPFSELTLHQLGLLYNGENIVGKTNGGSALLNCAIYVKVWENDPNPLTVHLNVHSRYISSSLSVTWTDVGNTYYFNDTITFTNITGTATWLSTDANDTGLPADISLTRSDLTISPITEGTQNYVVNQVLSGLQFTATYNHATGTASATSHSITCSAITLTSITVTTGDSWKSLANYIEKQYLDTTGLTITRNYSNGTTSALTSNYQIGYYNGSTFVALTLPYQFTTGDVANLTSKYLYVKYTDEGELAPVKIGETALTITALSLQSITVSGGYKQAYNYGETFDPNGLVVTAHYNAGSIADAIISSANYTFTGLRTPTHIFNPTNDGTTFDTDLNIKVVYQGQNVTLGIKLIKPVLSSISVDATSVITTYINGVTPWSETGLVVTANYQSGYTETLASNQYTITKPNTMFVNTNDGNKVYASGTGQAPYDFSNDRAITVSVASPYDNTNIKTNTYNISIRRNETPVSAIFQESDDYLNYQVGDNFDAHGISFELSYNDGTKANTTNGIVYSIALGTQFRSAGKFELEFYFTYNGTQIGSTYTKTLTVSLPNSTDLTEQKTYGIVFAKASDGVIFTQMRDTDGKVITLGKQYDDDGNLVGEYWPVVDTNKIAVDTVSQPSMRPSYGLNVLTSGELSTYAIGYMDMGITNLDGTIRRPAHLVLFDDPVNPIDGDGNIEVTFPHFVQGKADRINKSKFGKIYHNSLFVSGNDNFKNADWHSYESDFTYFSDLDYCRYGGDDTRVLGYDIFRDGDLIVVKEGSREQATLYRREYKLIEATDYAGNVIEGQYEPSYPMFDVNSNGGIGGISSKTITNFVGETIVLTKEGLKAITTKDDVYNSAKYSYDVSSYINPKIKYEELENAILFTFKEKLVLKTSRGIYIGYYKLRNEDEEYEWFFLSGINADLFFEYSGKLYYANDNGEISYLPELTFQDKDRTFIGAGGSTLTIDEQQNTVVVSQSYSDKIKEGNEFHLITHIGDTSSQVHAKLSSFINKSYRETYVGDITQFGGYIENNSLVINPLNNDKTVNETERNRLNKLFYNGRKIYLDLINSVDSGISATIYVNHEYALKKTADWTFKIYDGDTEVILDSIQTIRLSFIVNDLAITHITQITSLVGGGKQFKVIGDHNEILDFIYYNSVTPTSYSAIVTENTNVEAYYVTAPYVMESMTRYKTIWSWFIANDTALASYMDVGYISNNKMDTQEIIKTTRDIRQLSFGNIHFEKIQFETDKLPHIYTTYRTLPSVSFIRFIFKNFESSNIVLTTLQLVYTYNQFMKGVN